MYSRNSCLFFRLRKIEEKKTQSNLRTQVGESTPKDKRENPPIRTRGRIHPEKRMFQTRGRIHPEKRMFQTNGRIHPEGCSRQAGKFDRKNTL